LNSTNRKSAAVLYGSLLLKFQKWLASKKLPPLEKVTPVTIEKYLATLKSQSSVNGTLAAIRGYLKFTAQSLSLGDPNVVIETQRLMQVEVIKPKRRPRVMKKMSLTVEELKQFLGMLREEGVSKELYAGIVVLFYFGARSGEFAGLLNDAKVDMKGRNMTIQTEKTGAERYLSWDARLDPYMKTWYELVRKKKGLPYPGQWLTKLLKQELKKDTVMVGGTAVTSRTARRTFETQMRLQGTQDIVIRAVLGHTDHSISDVYTDFTQFVPEIDKAMRKGHYMILGGVI